MNKFLVVLILILSSCSRNYGEKLVEYLKKKSAINEKCKVSLNSAFEFEWDYFYIIDSMMYPEDISNIIGVEYDGEIIKDGQKLIIFVKNKVIIECTTTDYWNEINFMGMRQNGYIKINNKDMFCVSEKTVDGKKHYILNQMVMLQNH